MASEVPACVSPYVCGGWRSPPSANRAVISLLVFSRMMSFSCVLFDLIGSDDLERFVCDEHFLVFFVDGSIDFGGVQDTECSM